MVSQELVAYVKKQLSEGRSQEQITTTLMAGGGWNSSDIKALFRLVNAPAIAQPITTDAPYGAFGVVSMIIFGVLNYSLYLKILPVEYISKALFGFVTLALVPMIILWFMTYAANVPNRSFEKALFISGISSVVPILLSFIFGTHLIKIPNIVAIGVALSMLPIWLFMFKGVYDTTWAKSLLVAFLQLVFSSFAIVALVFALGISSILNIFNIAKPDSTVHIQPDFVSKNIETNNTISSIIDQNNSNFLNYLEIHFVNFDSYTPINISLTMADCGGYCPLFKGTLGTSGITFNAPYTPLSVIIPPLSKQLEVDKNNHPDNFYSIMTNKNKVQYEYARSGKDDSYTLSASFILNNSDFRKLVFQAHTNGKDGLTEQQFFDAMDILIAFNPNRKSIPPIPENIVFPKR